MLDSGYKTCARKLRSQTHSTSQAHMHGKEKHLHATLSDLVFKVAPPSKLASSGAFLTSKSASTRPEHQRERCKHRRSRQAPRLRSVAASWLRCVCVVRYFACKFHSSLPVRYLEKNQSVWRVNHLQHSVDRSLHDQTRQPAMTLPAPTLIGGDKFNM